MIVTATPGNYAFGTKDESWKNEPPMQPARPQFLPLMFFMGEKGTLEKTTANFPKMMQTFGAKTFDKDSKFYKHPQVFMEGIFSKAGLVEAERIIDPSIVVKSNITIWLDIALDDLPEYKRTHEGKYIYDANGEPETTDDTIEGYKYKIYYSFVSNDNYDTTKSGRDIYEMEVQEGYMTDKNGDSSTMYPLFTFIAASHGEVLNKEGFTIEAMSGDEADENMLNELKVFPYVFRRFSTYSGVRQPVDNIYGSNKVKFTLKDKVRDPLTKLPLQLDRYLPKYWENLDDYTAPAKYSDFDEPIVYYNNINIVSNILFEKEAPYVTTEVKTWDDGLDAATVEWFNFEADENRALTGQDLLFNILTGLSTNKVNYFTFVHNSAVVATQENITDTSISGAVTIYLKGGLDGDTSDEMFETVVKSKLDRYLNRDSMFNEMSLNPESSIIDTGYSMDVKLKMANILTYRRDIVPLISTYIHNEKNKTMSLDEEIALLNLIRNRFKLFPESEYFGTEQAKTIVPMASGFVIDSEYRYRVSYLYDLVLKMTEMMGASNGKWKNSKIFSGFNHNEVEYLKDIKIGDQPNVPYGIRSTLWKSGATWVQTKDKKTYFTPAVQTLYGDATSVLNNPVVAFAIATIEKIHEDCWEEHSGTTNMSNSKFKESVESYMNKRLDAIFDGVVSVKPTCIITDLDKKLGYSYNLVTEIYAYNMKTAQYSHIIAKRADEKGGK